MQKSEIQHRPRNPLQHPKLIIEIHQHWTMCVWLYYVVMSSRPHSTVNASILQSLYTWC